jgi:hypothetical protein
VVGCVVQFVFALSQACSAGASAAPAPWSLVCVPSLPLVLHSHPPTLDADDDGQSVVLGDSLRTSFDDLLEALHTGLQHAPDMVMVTGCGTSTWMPQLAQELGSPFGLGPSAGSDDTNLLVHIPLFVREHA